MIFNAIRSVGDAAAAEMGDPCAPCTLETLVNLVTAYTKIDIVEFVGYNTPADNPIWGSFRRFEYFQPYSGEITKVEIRYANHLSLDWLRFVVTKELCHALDTAKGSHSVSDDDVKLLITELSLASVKSSPMNQPVAVSMEKVAEVGAVEILIPYTVREKILADGPVDESRIEALAREFQTPVRYVGLAFDLDYMEISKDYFKAT
ncbi:hypothetical protein IGS74_18840 [Aureimonas sp. OT7]|uniref:hypothetical protein n=1 Tax=Aureimonas sp. OT7 TaxID=2816454 RepID=UPI00177FDF8C|nr:hypothetical protein [Aureimonas sp. OT7]QOG06539.1 hypothetical protein IGS74_18840 [Aureimonas sp. OT7]